MANTETYRPKHRVRVVTAAALFDAGQACGAEANMGKLLGSEVAWHAAETAMQTFGGYAFAREYGIERKWRECRLYQTAPISSNMILAISANTSSDGTLFVTI